MHSRPLIAALALAIAPLAPLQPSQAQVSFSAKGPAGLTIEGKTSALTLREDADGLLFTVPLASFQTGIEVRDRHLREDLEADKFPVAELRLRRAAPGEGTAQGTLTLHGQTRPISINYRVGKSEISANLKLNVTEYGIAIRSYLGVTVKPEVEVSVAFHYPQSGP